MHYFIFVENLPAEFRGQVLRVLIPDTLKHLKLHLADIASNEEDVVMKLISCIQRYRNTTLSVWNELGECLDDRFF